MTEQTLDIVGWREWGTLPEIGNEKIKIKVDTGAKTSCLHAFKIKPFQKEKQKWIRVWLHPEQESDREVVAEFAVFDRRQVRDSGGHVTQRYVIKTPIIIGGKQFDIELTLTNRDNMKFRMLLGRRALEGRFLVDSAASYLAGE
ncbi:ATP-dependent zinc protease family protein [Shewanella gaetbuli]|uniref:ATP-dependent zinc protease n=1 Tax=Shewanella gaetbuli TaxID=220752 RepID=A0A9X2CMS0_9GAMM|nr:ATP-dependent zinc protease [Shewanella gaetbuli]MCL1143960.1 ATP-dependent zinc protease [Shewanella gaetbuli]